jgi:hypothetical protein
LFGVVSVVHGLVWSAWFLVWLPLWFMVWFGRCGSLFGLVSVVHDLVWFGRWGSLFHLTGVVHGLVAVGFRAGLTGVIYGFA